MYTTIEANIEDGIIKSKDITALPRTAHVLITLLDNEGTNKRKRPDWSKIHAQVGKLNIRCNTESWQRRQREEWNEK